MATKQRESHCIQSARGRGAWRSLLQASRAASDRSVRFPKPARQTHELLQRLETCDPLVAVSKRGLEAVESVDDDELDAAALPFRQLIQPQRLLGNISTA